MMAFFYLLYVCTILVTERFELFNDIDSNLLLTQSWVYSYAGQSYQTGDNVTIQNLVSIRLYKSVSISMTGGGGQELPENF